MSTELAAQLGVRLRDGLTPAECRQVDEHHIALAELHGPAVTWDEARHDWLARHASNWRKARQEHMLMLQREEIARYRWIRSEEANRDVGRQAAVEWVKLHAAAWRQWYEETYA